jgi:NADH dehydrogenase FAD-containing subunit
MIPPKPAALYAVTATDRPPKISIPMTSAATGRLTIRPHTLVVAEPALFLVGQNAARPNSEGSARKVRTPAASQSMTTIYRNLTAKDPIAPKIASARIWGRIAG